MSAWVDVFAARPNVLGILQDNKQYALLTSPFHQPGPGNGFEVSASLPAGFQQMVSKGILTPRTRILLARFSYACQHGLHAVPQSEQPFADFTAAAPSLADPEPSLEKCLTLALVCYSRRRWSTSENYVAGMICHTIAKKALTQELPLVPTGDDDATIECLVWMWMVLVYAHCLEGTDLNKEGLSCLGVFKFHFPDWHSWERIERDILPNFFWLNKDSIVIRKAWDY